MDFSQAKPFPVLKFLKTESDVEEYVEVGLNLWLHDELDDNMCCQTFWPPKTKNASQLIKLQVPPDVETWPSYPCQVLRFYETFVQARAAATKFCVDSHYETESEQVPTSRLRKRLVRNLSPSSSEEDNDLKKNTKRIPTPPPVPVEVIIHEGPAFKKKRRLVDKAAEENKAKAELLERIQQGKKLLAERQHKSPQKTLSGMTSPWKVTSQKGTEISNLKHKSGQPSNLQRIPGKTVKPKAITSHPSASRTDQDHAADEGRADVNNSRPSTSKQAGGEQNLSDIDYFQYQNDYDDWINISFNDDNLEVVTSLTVSPLKSPNADKPSAQNKERRTPPVEVVNTVKCNLFSEKGNHSDNKRGNKSLQGNQSLFDDFGSKSVDEKLLSLFLMMKRNTSTLEEMKGQGTVVMANVGRIIRKILPEEKRMTAPSGMPKLPVTTMQLFNEFEKWLSHPQNEAEAIDVASNYIKTACAEPEASSTRRVMSSIVGNEVAQCFNMDGGGKKGRKAFRKTNCYKVVRGVLITAFPNCGLDAIDSYIQKWLKDANVRQGGIKWDDRKKGGKRVKHSHVLDSDSE